MTLLAEAGRVAGKNRPCPEFAWDLEREVEIAMDALRCPPGDAGMSEKLSGGEKRRVALCKLLLEKPDMLLLDEPTNHLDAESVAWLERFFARIFKGTVVIVTHDRYFLDNITKWILELDRGTGVPWEGNYSTWLEQKQKQPRAQDQKEESEGSRAKDHCPRAGMGAPARPRPARRRSKARIKAFDELLTQKPRTSSRAVAQIVIPEPGRKPRQQGGGIRSTRFGYKAFGDRFLHGKSRFQRAHSPRRRLWASWAPTGRGKPRCSACSRARKKPDGRRNSTCRRNREVGLHRPIPRFSLADDQNRVGGNLRRERGSHRTGQGAR